MAHHAFKQQPPTQTYGAVSFPAPHIVLVVFNRPAKLNAMTSAAQYELESFFAWFDGEPSLRCAVVTGAGRAFCAGMDLDEWNQLNAHRAAGRLLQRPMNPPSGFGALSRRHGKKPVIAAVNGLAYGGGLEMLANLDLVVAAQSASFALPEVKRGVVANAGSLPRLARTIGRPRAMELALTGRTITAAEAREWGLINAVTEDAAAQDCPVLERPVVRAAMEYAAAIAGNSPDSVVISRASIIAGWEHGSAENATRLLSETWDVRLNGCSNLHEGVRAFVEKRAPRWVDSKL
ncbi:enoyl-CoA hydratase/isomerase domain-containing protein [Hirsutella rhossiliensis]|uniref:Enoyl-CoA hydratase/isomerase domain-containing protein n=1 Tax=Hirsutella rhossiliensis TaxID=111463 RepID=A0A9P8SK21_9HYPO|nr:enoyl-CoA hydratase/isomerase domain-containing protein [Hirsutella rhossiliensis]KAH0964789.1 enoyl-CoA hydratase/isomerase domain-containing protein [Hirsutella rhossiliensis]